MLDTLGVADLQRTASARDAADAAVIEARIEERNAARAARDWSAADRIRDELVEMGIELHDGPDGTTWTRVVQK